MEVETIIYYHPMQAQSHSNCAAKRHWWQDAVLRERHLPEPILTAGGKCSFTLTDCPVPVFSYKRKAWKPEELSECMENVLHRASGMADAYLHPQIMTWVSDKYAKRWETCEETIELLFAGMLSQYGAACLWECGQVTVLLGEVEDTDWQMEMTWRLLEPYLERINGLVFYYMEREGVDAWEELSCHLESYSYEYGLVPQLMPYQTGKGAAHNSKKQEGVVLSYGNNAGGITVRYGGQIVYVSPLKYLDTMVKNSYDRLVH